MRLAALGLIFPLILTGCSLTPTAKIVPEKGSAIQGKAFGGQQPINGAHIYAYAAGVDASPTYIHTTFITTGLTLPTSVVPDSSGNLYITESSSGLVYLETPNGSGGYTQTSIGSGFTNPFGIAVDSSGDVFIADAGSGSVYMETPNGSGGYTQTDLGNPACGASGIAVDSSGDVYSVGTSCNHVTEYTFLSPGNYSTGIVMSAGSVVPCTSATGVAVDFSLNLYIACNGNSTVLFEANAGGGSFTESSIGTGLSSPTGVAVDPPGNVYIADTGNNRVLRETALGGTSFSQSVVDNITDPTGVTAAQDGSGLLYIASSSTNSILGEIPDPTASTSLLTAASNTTADSNGNYYVTTDSTGSFSITSDYTCNSGNQVYLLATGGDSGGGSNSAIGLLAILGNCPVAGTFSSSLFVFMNEVSTVAAAYVMAPFATDATHVYSNPSPLGLTGIQNAFANAASLANLGSGAALAANPAGTATVPQAEINTLANILGACVNSPGPGSSGCSTLTNNIPGSPTDTASAAIYLAHNPYPGATQIANLCGNQVPNTLFTPELPCNNNSGNTYPNDFTLSLTFTGNGITQPNDVAIDAAGDAWITSSSSVVNDLTELSPTGIALTGANGITPSGMTAAAKVAIDGTGNIWVTNNDGSAGIVELDSTGTSVGGSPFDAGTLGLINNIAIDASNNIWLSAGSNVVELDDTGTPVTNSPFTDSTITDAYGIAIDGSSDAWLTNSDTTDVVELSSSGTTVSGSPYIDSSFVSALGDAVDSDDNVWVANYGTGIGDGSISDISIGCCVAHSGLTTGSSFGPNGIAVDSAGNVWVSNFYSSIVEFNNSGTLLSPSTGYTSDALSTVSPDSIAIDGSGDVWVTGYAGGTDIVSEFIGAAAPVVTPVAANLQTFYLVPASKP
ncbi:MAG TPA: hypothetical protein VNU94_04685 [Acidobacteriaceae bacterium]|jgi:streptogramin lyase|nr:hypothetical protein [Acidobacteriaceae bacterium]